MQPQLIEAILERWPSIVRASSLLKEVSNPCFYYVPSPDLLKMLATNSVSSKTLCGPSKTHMSAEFNPRASS